MDTKTCGCCREDKPLTEFTRVTATMTHTYCKRCRSLQNMAARRRKIGRSPTEWMLPEMTLAQQLDCLRLRKWAGPVDRERPLVARLAA